MSVGIVRSVQRLELPRRGKPRVPIADLRHSSSEAIANLAEYTIGRITTDAVRIGKTSMNDSVPQREAGS